MCVYVCGNVERRGSVVHFQPTSAIIPDAFNTCRIEINYTEMPLGTVELPPNRLGSSRWHLDTVSYSVQYPRLAVMNSIYVDARTP